MDVPDWPEDETGLQCTEAYNSCACRTVLLLRSSKLTVTSHLNVTAAVWSHGGLRPDLRDRFDNNLTCRPSTYPSHVLLLTAFYGAR